MSAATQKPLNEASPVGASFSYAQAAKGRSPAAVPPTITSRKAPSEPADINGQKPVVSDTKTATADPTKVQAEDQTSINREEGDAKASAESVSTPSSSTELSADTAVAQPQPHSEVQPQATTSTPSSPSFGTASMSTLPKEDEALSAANGSSDSTWDKQSQGSQNGVKSVEKGEPEKEQSTVPTWDDEPSASASFKEAPPPAVNIWQHRKEMLNAKAKTMQSANLNALKPASLSTGTASTNSFPKSLSSENPLDPRKQDSKKKAKNISGHVEEKTVSGGSKEGSKPIEARSRAGEEGEHVVLCVSKLRILIGVKPQKRVLGELLAPQIQTSSCQRLSLHRPRREMQCLGQPRTVLRARRRRRLRSALKKGRKRRHQLQNPTEKRNGCQYLMFLQRSLILPCLRLGEAVGLHVVEGRVGIEQELPCKEVAGQRSHRWLLQICPYLRFQQIPTSVAELNWAQLRTSPVLQGLRGLQVPGLRL